MAPSVRCPPKWGNSKASVYTALDVTATYDPATHTAVATCDLNDDPCGKRACRRTDLQLRSTPRRHR